MTIPVCFIVPGPIQWASARYRAYWPAKHMTDAAVVVYQSGASFPKADNYVFIKVADSELADSIREASGALIVWDLCDPVHWFSPDKAGAMFEASDIVTASNDALAEDFLQWAGERPHVIPDRIDFDHYNRVKQHNGSEPVRFIWYGAGQNRDSLMPGLVMLVRLAAEGHSISLTISDDQPGRPVSQLDGVPVFMHRWTIESEVDTLLAHDIALLPAYPGDWGRVKSNNKQVTAWACGLPVIDGLELTQQVRHLIRHPETRNELARSNRARAEAGYDVRQSARDWETLLCSR